MTLPWVLVCAVVSLAVSNVVLVLRLRRVEVRRDEAIRKRKRWWRYKCKKCGWVFMVSRWKSSSGQASVECQRCEGEMRPADEVELEIRQGRRHPLDDIEDRSGVC